jgi:hypothetical protein
MKWYKIEKVRMLGDMHVEENYPNFHKSRIKGKTMVETMASKNGF